jgi:hypothetical protein
MDNEIQRASKFTYVLALHKPYEPETESERHSVSTVIAWSYAHLHKTTDNDQNDMCRTYDTTSQIQRAAG